MSSQTRKILTAFVPICVRLVTAALHWLCCRNWACCHGSQRHARHLMPMPKHLKVHCINCSLISPRSVALAFLAGRLCTIKLDGDSTPPCSLGPMVSTCTPIARFTSPTSPASGKPIITAQMTPSPALLMPLDCQWAFRSAAITTAPSGVTSWAPRAAKSSSTHGRPNPRPM